jgi:hypothetical protein
MLPGVPLVRAPYCGRECGAQSNKGGGEQPVRETIARYRGSDAGDGRSGNLRQSVHGVRMRPAGFPTACR